MDRSAIEWCDATWNTTSGCTKVSEGCRNCWAERTHHRFSEKPFSEVILHPDRLEQPLHWRKPRRIFVNSMSDLFHEAVPDAFIERAFKIMERCPQHTFQILTKRPERMLSLISSFPGPWKCNQRPSWPLADAWLGVSVEDQATADERIPLLLQTPAAVRFVSAEPMLGPVDLLAVPAGTIPGYAGLRLADMLHWVICGGESGPKARPMHPDWARSVRDQCRAAGVPFFFKQHGEWLPYNRSMGAVRSNNRLWTPRDAIGKRQEVTIMDGGQYMFRVGKKAAGRLLDGREWNEYPEVQI